MSSTPEPEHVHRQDVTVRSAPRFLNFALVGVIIGILVTLIATLAFEPNPEYTRLQVFGFLLLISVVIFGTLSLVLAGVIDHFTSKRKIAAVADRIDVNEGPVGGSSAEAAAAPVQADASSPEAHADGEPDSDESSTPSKPSRPTPQNDDRGQHTND